MARLEDFPSVTRFNDLAEKLDDYQSQDIWFEAIHREDCTLQRAVNNAQRAMRHAAKALREIASNGGVE